MRKTQYEMARFRMKCVAGEYEFKPKKKQERKLLQLLFETNHKMARTDHLKEWKVESYDYQAREVWPGRGQHILAQYDQDSIVVYQAFCPEIADYAVEHLRFVGCPCYNPNRMTWIKTNFLWMMFRSRWASKPRQERILAILLRRDRFDYYLKCARTNGSVRVQMDQCAVSQERFVDSGTQTIFQVDPLIPIAELSSLGCEESHRSETGAIFFRLLT